jgi:WD repeat-containing protein 21A
MLTESSITVRRRKLPSDVLAVHHASRDMVFAGLRSSAIVMEDLRVPSKQPNIVATLPAGKAVTGVQRLRDSAVPFGLAVSGLSHQLMLFDIRFARPPLLEFEGHVNTYHISSLALTTSPDDSVLIAGGSDCRLRAWSTRTGNRIESRGPEGAFSMSHSYRVQHVDVADDLTIRVATAGDVLCFRPPR